MNCQQFQEVLPYIIESGGSEQEEAHLRSCPACSELVQDLRYIAEQAKLLLPLHDPNPRVWTNIEQSLHREGLLTEGRMSRLGHTTRYPTAATQSKSSTPVGWLLAVAAMVLFAAVLLNYRPHLPSTQVPAQNTETQSAQLERDDEQVLSQISQQGDVRRAYEDGLKEANAYIADAEQALTDDPQDAAAREQLLQAHQQKEMLYEMATARSLP